jgi:hypothetical protein
MLLGRWYLPITLSPCLLLRTSGMDKFSSVIDRMNMELGGRLHNSLRIETQFLERLQSVSVVDGATHTQKDDVKSNGGSLENVAEIFVLFLCGVQLVLRSGVLTVFISTRWMSRRGLLRSLGRYCLGLVALLVAGGAAEVLPVSLNCPLPLRKAHPPTLVCCFYLCFASMGITSTKSGRLEVNLSLSGKRDGKSHFAWNNSTFSCFRNLDSISEIPHNLGDSAWSSVRCCLYLWRQRMILRSLFC